MAQFRHRIAFIIPTRNRLELLSNLLRSLQEQTVQADQVIIVDGSDQPIESEIKEFLSPTVSYMRVFPPSLTKQRNEGVKALNDNITLVGYLDDDTVLERDAVEAMLRFWEHCPDDVGGSSFNITNRPTGKVSLFTKLFEKLFSLNDGRQGVVLRSGASPPLSPVLKDTYTQFLSGGTTVWRRQVLEEFKYDEWFTGGAYVEDIDFSFTVAKKYKLVVLEGARLQHFPLPYNTKKCYSLGKTLVKQRYHLIRKHAELSVPLFYWSTVGRALSLILGGVLERNAGNILTAFGNIAGLFEVFKGNLAQSSEEFRK